MNAERKVLNPGNPAQAQGIIAAAIMEGDPVEPAPQLADEEFTAEHQSEVHEGNREPIENPEPARMSPEHPMKEEDNETLSDAHPDDEGEEIPNRFSNDE